MQLISNKHCLDLWDKYEMPENIRRHSEKVTMVAEAVAMQMQKMGFSPNIDLVNRGALLHDIAKIIAVNDGRERDHGMMGAEIAIKENLGSEVSEIIRKHYMDTFNEQCTLEELAVNYADKRVVHDTIVSLDERFDYICSNYPAATADINIHRQKYYDFEKKFMIDQLEFGDK